MAGRKPIPTAVKELRGNPGHRPLNALEPTPTPGEPEMPSGLSRYAKVAWKRVVPQLLKMGVLTEADGDALSVYCEAWATWKQANIDIKKSGLYTIGKGSKGQDIIMPNPAVVERDKAIKVMEHYQAAFGLEPSSRSRLKVEKPQEVDPLEQFLTNSIGTRTGVLPLSN